MGQAGSDSGDLNSRFDFSLVDDRSCDLKIFCAINQGNARPQKHVN
jgi:hypothetical protein